MKKLVMAALAATTGLTMAGVTHTAAAQEGVSLSANVALVSDYRFRGFSLSDKDPAIQGGFDVGTDMGFYIGTWGSSIEQFNGAETEIDFYGGYATTVGMFDLDAGVIGYFYPGGTGTDYYEFYGSAGTAVGPLGVSLGVAYVPDQSNVGNTDNLYINLGAEFAVPETPLTLNAGIGRERGAFGKAPGSDKWDWTVGATFAYGNYSFGVAYVDTNLTDREGDATAVVTIGASF